MLIESRSHTKIGLEFADGWTRHWRRLEDSGWWTEGLRDPGATKARTPMSAAARRRIAAAQRARWAKWKRDKGNK